MQRMLFFEYGNLFFVCVPVEGIVKRAPFSIRRGFRKPEKVRKCMSMPWLDSGRDLSPEENDFH